MEPRRAPGAGPARRYRRLAAGAVALLTVTAACTADPESAAGPRSTLAELESGSGGGTSADAASGDGADVRVAWQSCTDTELDGLECATVEVPLDHARPDGDTIEIALARRAASSPGERIGSLFVNPGGPGASGVELVPQLASAMDASVLDRFDLVGFDPRGVGRSTAVRCIDDHAALNALDGDPDTEAEVQALAEEQAAFVATCTERHGDLLPYLSTAATARDLDVLRRAVGDEQLTYLGFSYGTQLGATYAALFPDDIRVLVLDGAVGPNLTDDELALTQAKGFERAFGNFVAACRTDDACDAGPDAAATFERVRAEVEAGPIPVSTAGERRELQVGDFQYGVVGALYDQALWAFLARGLAEADRGDGATLLALADLYNDREADGTYPNADEANTAISCADSTERRDLDAARQAAERYEEQAPTFGPFLGWSAMACNGWPLGAEPQPTIVTTTSAPILVIGTVNDPATPYEWAGQLDEALQPASRLLTWQGEGHTAYLKSDCVTEAVDELLVELSEPADGTTCPAEATADGPFAGIVPDLRDALVENGGLDERTATCVAETVQEGLAPADLTSLYGTELSPSLERLLTGAVADCVAGG
ncbi:MAG: alpha/beta hydrolase [Acidimicrobiia bacterium]